MTMALTVRDLQVHVRDRDIRRVLVETVSLDVRAGAMLGIVGETGAGKTLTVRSLVGLLPPGVAATGEMSVAGERGIELSDLQRLAPVRGTRIGIVLQNPISMFDPMLRLRAQLIEGVVRRRLLDRRQALDRARALMRRLGFENVDHVLDLFPHQLSGGMGQRLAIAMVLMPKPSVIIADEPTSALDANLRVEALRLLREIGAEERTAIILVSHDLGLVSNFCDDLAVMYAGRIVEQGPAREVLGDPQHPYARALADCSPSLEVDPRRPLASIAGSAPTPNQWPPGCTFAPRCPLVFQRCIDERPLLRRHDAQAGGMPPRVRGRPVTVGLQPVLVVDHVSKDFHRRGVAHRVLNDVSCSLPMGRTLAVVGESGAGKTTLARTIAGLERPTLGRVLVDGRPPVARGGVVSPVQMVFQQPGESLNPYISIRASVAEPLHHVSAAERRQRVSDLLVRVGINPAHASRRPRAFSGGQLQRIVLARALAAAPKLLLCDEPTSALDVSVQAQMVNLLLDLQASLGFACLLVTHDLSLVRVLADDILVLRDGWPVEQSDAAGFFAGPKHAYARGLLEANRLQTLYRRPGPRSPSFNLDHERGAFA